MEGAGEKSPTVLLANSRLLLAKHFLAIHEESYGKLILLKREVVKVVFWEGVEMPKSTVFFARSR